MYTQSKPELDKNFIDVKGLSPGEIFEFIVVAVDGEAMRESDVADIETSSSGTVLINLSHYR